MLIMATFYDVRWSRSLFLKRHADTPDVKTKINLHTCTQRAELFNPDSSAQPQEGTELMQFWKVRKHEDPINSTRAKGDVYFTDSHLIWCHYARTTLIFKKKGEGRTARQRLAYAIKPPGGVWVFLAFQSDAAMRPRIWPWLPDAASPTRPQFKSRGWEAPGLWHDFHNFLLDCGGKRMKARSVRLAGLGAWLNPPHRWLCVKRPLPPRRWRMQRSKWRRCLSSRFLDLKCPTGENFNKQILFHASVSFRHTESRVCCLSSVLTCCYPNANHEGLHGKERHGSTVRAESKNMSHCHYQTHLLIYLQFISTEKQTFFFLGAPDLILKCFYMKHFCTGLRWKRTKKPESVSVWLMLWCLQGKFLPWILLHPWINNVQCQIIMSSSAVI